MRTIWSNRLQQSLSYPQLSVLRPAGERHRSALLQNIAGSLEAWTLQVKREKGVYHTLNKLSVDVTRKVLFVGFWALFFAPFVWLGQRQCTLYAVGGSTA